MSSNRPFYDYEVARESGHIMICIKGENTPISIEDIIHRIFRVAKTDSNYLYYHEAVERFLRANRDMHEVEKGKWRYGTKSTVIPTRLVGSKDNKDITTVVSYIERLKGYMYAPDRLINATRMKLRRLGQLDMIYEGCQYEFNWNWMDKTCYIYGNGVMDFYADANLWPGQEITFSVDDDDQINISVNSKQNRGDYGFERSTETEAEKLLSKQSHSSLFTSLYELLALYPEGMDLNEIFKRILHYRITTVYEIKNVLKQNECFEYDVSEDRWSVKVESISRYYKDEHGDARENELSFVWLFSNDSVLKESKQVAKHGEDIKSDDSTNPLTADRIGEIVEETILTGNKSQHDNEDRQDTDRLIEQEVDEPEPENLTISVVVASLARNTVEPNTFKDEIDILVKQQFQNGELDIIEKDHHHVKKLYSYFLNMEKFIEKWKGKV